MLKSGLILIIFSIFSSLLFMPALQGVNPAGLVMFILFIIPLGSFLASPYSQRYVLPVNYGIIMGAWISMIAISSQSLYRNFHMSDNSIFWGILTTIVATTGGSCLLSVLGWAVGQEKYWKKR